MGEMLWSLAVMAAFVVFVIGLVQGKGFFTAVKMGVGVLILGFVGVLALGLVAAALSIAWRLAILVLWLVIIATLVSVVARVLKGAA